MADGTLAVLGLYAVVLPVWLALSFWSSHRAGAWAFTPRWHRRAVPLFRAFFLVTLPLEFVLAERAFLAPVFVIAAGASLAWLAWRAAYLARAPARLPRADSVRYNGAYVANLAVFALACHSFVCLAVMINVSLPLLLVREHCARRAPASPAS